MRLTSLLLAAATTLGSGAAVTLTGCAGEGSIVVEDEPPAPREEVVETRPGFIFVHGHWDRDGGRWAWRAGRYERERVGHTYVQGHWERRGKGHVWIEGGWRG
jgi:hypothetical protein